MYYELYIDVYFLINLVMDYLLLLLVRSILKCTATHLRMLLGGLTGAAGACGIVLLPASLLIGKLILTYGILPVCMVKIGLQLKGKKLMVKGIVLFYLVSFLTGGVDLSVFFSGQLCTDPGRNGSLPAFYGQKWKYLSGSAVLEGKMLSHHGVTGYGKQLKRPCQE